MIWDHVPAVNAVTTTAGHASILFRLYGCGQARRLRSREQWNWVQALLSRALDQRGRCCVLEDIHQNDLSAVGQAIMTDHLLAGARRRPSRARWA